MAATVMPAPGAPRAELRPGDGVLEVALSGAWRLEGRPPRWAGVMRGRTAAPARVRLTGAGLESWDTSVLLFIADARAWCDRTGIPLELEALPGRMRDLAGRMDRPGQPQDGPPHCENLLGGIGLATMAAVRQAGQILSFLGECALDTTRLVTGRSGFRWRDCLAEMQQCGAMALPIVSLISFLVGVTIAYSGAVILQKFGGNIWIADLVGVSMAREMAALMTAIIMAGRTGAAFAAQIGAMKGNEEVDALETIGIAPVRFLVLPRVLALALMMPMLTAYAGCLGVLGGMAIAGTVLEIPPSGYWVELLTSIGLGDLLVGLIKAVTFGVIVGLSGCLRGLHAERSAAGVGQAATSAVVTAILLITVADALFGVIFHLVGL